MIITSKGRWTTACNNADAFPTISLEDQQIANSAVVILINQEYLLTFQQFQALFTVLYTLITIVMLQRTQSLGDMITMLVTIANELKKFLFTFVLIFIAFIVYTQNLGSEIKQSNANVNFWESVLDLVKVAAANQNFKEYSDPQGVVFVVLFLYLINIMLISFLVSMFINRYNNSYVNLESVRRSNIIKLKNSNSYNPHYGALTNTFFPISIVCLPFMIFLVVFKSERLNDFLLKMQYTVMILLYCLLGSIISVALVPILYVKTIANQIFIFMNSKRVAYPGQNAVNLLLAVFFNPILILASLVVDLIGLPNLLLKDSKGFEHKYQTHLEILNDQQHEIVLKIFVNLFYVNYFTKWAGKRMTMIEMMKMHLRVFQIQDNLHDLMCRGNKDYKYALANVQDYNMTKIMTKQSAVPDKTGDIKQFTCEFNLLFHLQTDVELYNYLSIVFEDFFDGKYKDETVDVRILKKKAIDHENARTFDASINSSMSMLLLKFPGQFKRNNGDFFNNFWVNITARSFTDIEEVWAQNASNQQAIIEKQVMRELGPLETKWASHIFEAADHSFRTIEAKVNSQIEELQEKEEEQAFSMHKQTISRIKTKVKI